MKSNSKAITKAEQDEFSELIVEIHGELTSAAENLKLSGAKLERIKTGKLYRAKYQTWDEFCDREFGWSRSYAHRIIQASTLKMLPMGNKIKSERQARALNKVPEEHHEEVIERIEKSGAEVTAKAIEITAEELLTEKAQADHKKKKEPEVVKDLTGYPIPQKRLPLFHRTIVVKDLLTHISAARAPLDQAQEEDDELFRCPPLNDIIEHLNKAYDELKTAVPYAVCPDCQGEESDACMSCKGRGMISQFFWNTAVPEEMKEIRRKIAT